MSNPVPAAVQSTPSETLTFEQQVNDIVNKATVDDKGNLALPGAEQVPEEVQYAAILEKRRRDTQSALGKATQQLAAESRIREELEKRVASQTSLSLTPEQTQELESLKLDNPEAWRDKMNKLEQEATTIVQAELQTLSSEASQHAQKVNREQILKAFNSTAKVPITDESLENDIPPRIVKRLETGAISFEEFLNEAQDYITAPKKLGGVELPPKPNLSAAGGSSEADPAAIANQSKNNYSSEIY